MRALLLAVALLLPAPLLAEDTIVAGTERETVASSVYMSTQSNDALLDKPHIQRLHQVWDFVTGPLRKNEDVSGDVTERNRPNLSYLLQW